MLPELSPVNRATFNYAPIAVGAVLFFPGSHWLLSAHKWFTGPKVQGTEEELRSIEAGLGRACRQLEGVD